MPHSSRLCLSIFVSTRFAIYKGCALRGNGVDPSDLQGILPWVSRGSPGGDEVLSPEEGLLDRLTGNIACVVNLHASARDANHIAKLLYADLEV